MRRDLFQPTTEGEARILLLIAAFSGKSTGLDGRLKLAKLDFLLRYPRFLKRALLVRAPDTKLPNFLQEDADTIEERMVRYRYGPWDPAYYAILGRLIGKGLINPLPTPHGVGYRVTDRGRGVAGKIAATEAWAETAAATRILKSHFDLTGTSLKEFIYRYFPEVVGASWGQEL